MICSGLFGFILLLGQQDPGQIQIQLDDGNDRIPAIRRTDARDEPALVKIVEQRGPGAMSALFSLGYLREPAPRTREVLREAASSNELLTAYPAICSLWRIDDAEWRRLALAAIPKLARSQQLHVANLLFRDGDYSAWKILREPMLDLLAMPGSEQHLQPQVFGLIAAAWMMREDAPGEPLRDLRRMLVLRPAGPAERERLSKMLDEFDWKKHSGAADPSNRQIQ
jgi:hypothetical protein